MAQFPPPICIACSRLTSVGDTARAARPACAAFPTGVPEQIWEGGADHREPFPGDHGIRFDLDPDGGDVRLAGYEASLQDQPSA